MHLKFSPRGDTMVEVLICIAIAGLVIAGSYALSSHSLQEGVSATEHTEANKLAEGQVEALKLREKSSTTTWTAAYPNGFNIPSGNYFCLDTTANSEFLADGVTRNPAWLPQKNGSNPQDLTGYNSTCAVNSKYYLSMSTNGDATNGQVYLVVVYWEPIGGGPLNQSQLYYRLPPESP